jgi:glutamate racemase
MSIGVFDSGIGGLSIHRALVSRLPGADFIYLADQAHAPYGGLSGERIVELTRAGAERLFDAGASLVVLACNTASAHALRRLQQTWLPDYRRAAGRPVNLLGIIVPTIEAATGVGWAAGHTSDSADVVGVFSTPGTTASQVYEIETAKRAPNLRLVSQPCPDLARMIEAGATRELLAEEISGHVEALTARIGQAPDRAILGCTHYELVADLFAEALPPGTPLISQPTATAEGLARYLEAHPEYEAGDGKGRRFLTTGRPGEQNALAAAFWGEPLRFEAA